eukprot:9635922-Karenia_brevis.AAC.1
MDRYTLYEAHRGPAQQQFAQSVFEENGANRVLACAAWPRMCSLTFISARTQPASKCIGALLMALNASAVTEIVARIVFM